MKKTIILGLVMLIITFQSKADQLICSGIYSAVDNKDDQKIKITEVLKLEKPKASYTSATSNVTTSDSKFAIQAFASFDSKGKYKIGIEITENKTSIIHSALAESQKISLFIKDGKSPNIKKIMNIECDVQK